MTDGFDQGMEEKRLQLAMEAADFDLWENDLISGAVTRKPGKIFAELGYDDSEAANYIDDIFALIHPDDIGMVRAALNEHLTGATTHYRCEFRLRARDGAWFWYANHGKIIDIEGQKRGHRFIGITFRIDDRKRRDAERDVLTRALTLLSECSTILIHAGVEQVFLDAICELAVETGGYMMAWVGYPENDAEKSVSIRARSGHEDGYLDSVKVTWSDAVLGQGPAGTALKTATTVINHDYEANTSMTPWRAAASKRGYRASTALPLFIKGRVFGVFNVYAADPCSFSSAEVALLEELASNLSYGIETIRTREENAQAQLALKKENEKNLALLRNASDGIHILDTKGNIIEASDSFCAMLGYRREEMIGMNVTQWDAARSENDLRKMLKQQLAQRSRLQFETRHRCKNGDILDVEVSGNALILDGKPVVFNSSRDISARKNAEEKIHTMAFFDALTSLPNRRLLMDRFHSAMSASARSGHYGAVLVIDIDRFKTVNDVRGHGFGDLLLAEIASRIQSCVRDVDTVARLGGDEFVVLLAQIDEQVEGASQKAALTSEKIRAALTRPYHIKGSEQHSSPSIGVSLYLGNEDLPEVLLRQADIAMYKAKDAGRNTVRFFNPDMQLAVETHAALEADLRRAIPGRQLHLYYQIQVDSDQRAIGAEALVRWIHPERGIVSPMRFIPIAEESSLIFDIGGWVLERACSQLAAWAGVEKTRYLTMAVNVSAQQFKQPDFVEMVAATLSRHRVEASRLKLELTESVVLNDVNDVVSKMYALKALGVSLSMDDFGTGYSSLAYLKKLPLDQIKIDQSFVRDITTDPNDAVMVKTIIDLAMNFRLHVIAEGVETESQLAFLKRHGCMAYQGFLFSRPVPIEAFEALLNQV